MNDTMTRRHFMQSTAITGAALAALGDGALAADDDRRITLALVGCAHIHTPSFVNLLKGRKDVRVKYVWDPTEARATKRASSLGSQVVKDVQEVWNDPEVAAVVICSETNRHRDLVLAAATARKHLFAEKPLGVTSKESFEMAGAIEKANLLFTTGYFMRTTPEHLFLKEQVAQGVFGKITRVNAWNCHSGSLGGWFDEKADAPADSWRWMADPKIAGVGAFGDLGTHMLDILMWIFGDVEKVTADIEIVTGRYPGCDEMGQGMLKFKNGVSGTLTAGWVDVASPVTLIIAGTEAHAMIYNGELYFKCKKVEGADGKGPWKQLPKAPPVPLAQFVDAVGGKKDQPLVTPREAAARVSVMEAMYEAARAGTWVKPA